MATEKPVSPIAVANYLLKIGDDLDRVRLADLVYLCHGWHLTTYGTPLVDEEPEAWRYGPMFPSLYQAIKDFGDSAIAYPVKGRGNGRGNGVAVLTDQQKELIDTIHSSYNEFTGWEILRITEQEKSPWRKVWLKNYDRNAPIPNRAIKKFFDAKEG